MLYYTAGQWKVFLAMIPAGFIAGAWYGVVDGARRLMRSGPALSAACDLIASVGAWLVVTIFMIATNFGEIRLYSFLGALAGFALERVTLGALPALARRAFRKLLKIFQDRQEKSHKMKNSN